MISILKTLTVNCVSKTTTVSKQQQQVRFTPRWSHRRPVKVLTPSEYEEIEAKHKERETPVVKRSKTVDSGGNRAAASETRSDDDEGAPTTATRRKHSLENKYSISKINWKHSATNADDTAINYAIKSKSDHGIQRPLTISNATQKKTIKTDMFETVIDQDGNFIYTKMGNNDHRVGSILTEVKSKKEMGKKDQILLEGKRLIKDALQSGCSLKYLIFSRKDEVDYLKPFLPKLGAKLYKMPYNEMQLWSDLTTNPGIMGIFKTPDVQNFSPKDPAAVILPLTVICDNIREPGNLGSVLRICAGVGCREVILTKGCVNVWDTKVLRSSAGAHFKQRIYQKFDWNQIQEMFQDTNDLDIYVADNNNHQRIFDQEEDTEEHKNDNDNVEEIVQKLPLVPYYGVNFYRHTSSPTTIKHNILVVGGEVHGISLDCYNVAANLNGVRLNIPLSNDVDSLNVGAALGVIAFEMKRQFSRIS